MNNPQQILKAYRSENMFKLAPLLILLFLFSCKKNTETGGNNLDQGYAFAPTDSGYTWVYRIDSISFDDNTQKIDTFHFYLKEKIIGKVSDQNNKNHMIVERMVRANDTANWLPRSNVYLLRTENNLQRVEENIRVVKMVFPIGNTQSWNGNMYNNMGWQAFYLHNIGSDFNNGDTIFGNTISIQEDYADNAIEEILIESVYTRNVGLIDFTNNYINTQVSGKSGYKVRQKLIQFSKP